MLGSSPVSSGFSKWLRRHFYISVFTCSFLPTTSSTDFSTSPLSTSKDWWRHFRNSEFILRRSKYSRHHLRSKEPIHFLNQVIRIILQSGLPGLRKFFNGFTWVLGCINTKWVLHVWGFTMEMSLNCDLCHFLQYIKIFPVNINYSARTALYVSVIKKKKKR